MSDTTTITPEERATLRALAKKGQRSPKNMLRALGAIAQAEARAARAENCLNRAESVQEDLLLALHAIAAEFGCANNDAEIIKSIRDLKTRAEKAEAEVARLTKALEIQRNLTASAHATAEAAWGGEIPSPFPGHKPPSEDAMVERFNHLNCPLCGGSGHIDDCDQTSAEAIARLTKERGWLANKLIDCPPKFTNCAVDCAECRKESARRAVAAGEETCQK